MLKNRLYNPARVKFQIKQATNHIIGKRIGNKGFAVPVSLFVSHEIEKVQNNNAATQIHTINHINTLPKNDQSVTSFGALSNKETSGFQNFLESETELFIIWEFQIGGIFQIPLFVSVIMNVNYINKLDNNLNLFF